MIALAQLSESDKRLIIVLLLVFVLVFLIVGYLGVLIKKIMTFQGKKMDDLVHDVVVTGVIKDSKKLVRYGIKKNHRKLFKNSWIPVLILLISGLVMLIYCIIYNDWTVNPIGYEDGKGFGTLFFIFDWDNAPRSDFFGLTLISGWPEVIHSPTWSWLAWGSYIFVPGTLIGGIWFLIDVQAYIARSYRLFKLSKTVFNKSLENFDASEMPREPIKPE